MTSCTKKIIIQLLCHCELFIQHVSGDDDDDDDDDDDELLLWYG